MQDVYQCICVHYKPHQKTASKNEHTCDGQRKYFRCPSQVLSFLAGISVKKLRKWRAVYFDKASSQSGWNLEMYKNKKASQVVTCKALSFALQDGLEPTTP